MHLSARLLSSTIGANKEKDILGILYQTGQQNLISFKDNQWSTTNYSLLGIAGIVAAFSFIHEAHILDLWSKYIAVFAVLLIAGFGTVLVTDLQLGIRVNRVAINQIKKALFPDKIAGYPGLSDSTITMDRRFFRSAELPILFYASILVGFGTALLIIVSK